MNRLPHKNIIYTDWDAHTAPEMHHRFVSHILPTAITLGLVAASIGIVIFETISRGGVFSG